MGLKVNRDKEEQKLSEIIFELFSMVCFIWFKLPKVNFVSLMATSKSINNSSFGSTLLQVLMALVAMFMHL